MNEKETIAQHKIDAEKALIDLDTMKQNVFGNNVDWNNIVLTRKKHINSFLDSLMKREEEYQHFK